MNRVIDESIVRMRFDGEQFRNGIRSALDSLSNLKNGIKSGVSAIGGFAGKISAGLSLGNMERSLNTLSDRFSNLGIVGMTAIGNITNAAVDAGKKIADALVIAPVRSGFQEYETQINAVQTILANTESKGSTLEDVNKALDELNVYADKTIYNFTQMTRNIGTFTAAGVDLDTSVQAIKGIANLAAVSGSTSQQASTAMYQLSQALAAGSLKLQDWNSVVNAGMGGQVFQDALKETARVHGIAIDDMIKKEGSFRETLRNGWISTEILTETLAKFTGDLSEAELKAIGYTDEQIKSIIKMGQTANDAATKVKTFTQLIDTLNESLQSGWTQSWEILIGDFEEAKALLTEISDTLSEFINKSSESRNALLQSWKDLGGRDSLIEAARNSMEAITQVTGRVKKAFTDIFPPLTANKLFEITDSLRKFSETLKKASEIKLTFLTEVLSAVKGIFKTFSGMGDLTNVSSVLVKVNSALSDFTGRIKQAVPAAVSLFKKALTGAVSFFREFYELGGVSSAVEIIGNVLRFAGNAALAAVSAFTSVFSSFKISAGSVYSLVERVRELTVSFLSSETAADNLKRIFTSVFGFIRTIAETVGTAAKIFVNLARSVMPILISAFTSGVNIFGSFIRLAVNLAGSVLPILVSVFGTAVTAISSFAGQGLSLAGQILPSVINAVGTAVRIVSEFIRKFIALGGVTSAAGALKNVFGSVRKILGTVSGSFSAVFGTARSGVSAVVYIIEKIRQLTGTFLDSQTASYILEKAFTSFFMLIKTGTKALKKAADIFTSLASSALPALKRLFDDLIPSDFTDYLRDIASGMSGILAALKNLTGFKSGFFSGLTDLLSKGAALIYSFVKEFAELGGISSLLDAVRNSFLSVLKIANLVKQAFVQIFPSSGANASPAYRLAENFRQLTAAFLDSETAADRLRRIFAGVFAAFDIGRNAAAALASAAEKIIKGFAPVGGNVLDAAASMGDFIVKLDESVKSSGIFGTVLDKAAGFLTAFMNGAALAAEKVKGIFSEFKTAYGDVFVGFIAKAKEALAAVSPIFSGIGELVTALLGCFGDFAKSALDNLSLDSIADIFGTGAIAAMAVGVRSFVNSISELIGSDGILGSLTGVLDGAKGCLESWQNAINAGIIKQIAIALAILAASLISLSLIDKESLVSSMTAVTFMLGEVIGAMAILSKIAGGENVKAMRSLPLQMIGISLAMLILAGAVTKLAALDWEGVAKGVVGIGALLTEIGIFQQKMNGADQTGKTGLTAMLGLIALAKALDVMSEAVARLSVLDWENLGKGILGIGLLLTELGVFVNNIGGAEKVISTSVGMIALGAAMLIFASAVERMGSISLEQIGKSLLAMAGILTEITAAMNLLPKNTLSAGVGLIAAAAAIAVFSSALQKLGDMSLEQIGKGLLAMVVSLAAIVIALKAASGGLGGAAAILLTAAAISVLTPALIALGNLSLAQIGKSLLTIAGIFGVMAAAGALLAPLTPTILALGGAMLMLGAAVALLGAGTLALSAGLSALLLSADSLLIAAASSIGDMVKLVCEVLTENAPAIVQAVVVILDEILKAVGTLAVSLIDAAEKILIKLIELINVCAPMLVDCVADVVTMILERIADDTYKIIECGMKIIDGILRGIADNIQSVIEAAVDIVLNFINGIASKFDDIIEAGINLVISLIDGIAKGIEDNSEDLYAAVDRLVKAIIDGVIKGLKSGVTTVVDAVKDIGTAIVDGFKELLGIHSPSKVFEQLGEFTVQGLANGISGGTKDVSDSAESLGELLTSSMRNAADSVSDIFSGETVFSPTVRPVMDLDNVYKGAAETSDLFSGNTFGNGFDISGGLTQSMAQSAANDINGTTSSGTNTVSGNKNGETPLPFTFNQYITTPDPVSPRDVKRYTRRGLQLAAVKY
ncbi:MAG: tape measure protein [Ruminococcus sp.]|nr:tape measure protein [Ruminococcus sp.]